MEDHFTPRENIFQMRNNFYAASQQDGESVVDFADRLRYLSTSCNFGDNLESILIDKFVFGLKSGKIKDRICEENPILANTTLELIVDIALANEIYLTDEMNQANWIMNNTDQHSPYMPYQPEERKFYGSTGAFQGDRKNAMDRGGNPQRYFQSEACSSQSIKCEDRNTTELRNNFSRQVFKRQHTGTQM